MDRVTQRLWRDWSLLGGDNFFTFPSGMIHGASQPGLRPISANLFGMFFFTPNKTVILSGVEGPRRCLFTHAARIFPTAGPHGFSSGAETKSLLASCVSQQILLSGFGG